MFDVPPPLQSKGRDAYRRTWDLFFAWSREPIVFDVMEMSVTAGSDIAFVAAVMRCSGTERGKDVDLLFRLTVGLQKDEGHWTIVHEHHSVPAEP
jgi:ketosteroid isomerase-like protein